MILRFEGPPKGRRKGLTGKVALGVAAMAVGAVGWTFAGNIDINSSSAVTFGQGVARTVSCDDSITLTPKSTYSTEAGFLFSGIEISDVDSTSDGCAGKEFVFHAYGPSNNSLTSFVVDDNGSSFSSPDGAITSSSEGTSTSSVFLAFESPSINSQDVLRITVETGDQKYRIGGIGPGGGIIFYDAGSHQSWGRFIEAAPANWNGGTDDPNATWCSNTFLDVNSDSTAIGDSVVNTDRMTGANCSSGVGVVVRNYHGGGKNDWSVPSLGDIQVMAAHADIVHGLASDAPLGYWTSNGETGRSSWIGTVWGIGGGQGGVNKSWTGPYVRPVRYF